MLASADGVRRLGIVMPLRVAAGDPVHRVYYRKEPRTVSLRIMHHTVTPRPCDHRAIAIARGLGKHTLHACCHYFGCGHADT